MTLPIEVEVTEVKEVTKRDEDGEDKFYKYKLYPSNDKISAFWTGQFEEDVLQEGDILELSKELSQQTFDDIEEEDDSDE